MGVRKEKKRSDVSRRSQLLAIGLIAVSLATVAGVATEESMLNTKAEGPHILIYTDIWCNDCTEWAIYLGKHGFETESVLIPGRDQMHQYFGVRPELRGPFVALVDGYVIEGHVPAEDILRLLKERPVARGLAVPGRPGASPGMERYAHERNPYEVVLFGPDGAMRSYARHSDQ